VGIDLCRASVKLMLADIPIKVEMEVTVNVVCGSRDRGGVFCGAGRGVVPLPCPAVLSDVPVNGMMGV